MNNFVLFAQPWWVNLLILIPVASYFAFRNGLTITKKQLLTTAVFGIAFGFVEAAVVVYLRAATGLLSQPNFYQPAIVLNSLPKTLFTIEFFREAATIIMILTMAVLAATKLKERCAIFLWVFVYWDLFYYFGLWLTTRWPNSITNQDVLFLIPVPWVSQVWFPYLVSGATLFIIALNSKGGRGN